jgi:hypothetical protein
MAGRLYGAVFVRFSERFNVFVSKNAKISYFNPRAGGWVFFFDSFTSDMYADRDDGAKRGDFTRVSPSWGQNRFWLSSSPRFFSANVVVFRYLLLLRCIIF